MKKLLLTFALLTFVLLSSAQSNYKPGHIITSSGDTVKGLINYREWNRSPKYIEFKATEADRQAVRYYPLMLKSFEVTGLEKYLSYTGPVSMDKNKVPNLPAALDTTTAIDTVFMQVRYMGYPSSLLLQEDNLKTRLFVQEKGQMPVELKFYQYYVNGTNSYRSSDAYKGTLMLLANKYNPANQNVNKAIAAARFTADDIQKVLQTINGDEGKKTTDVSGADFIVGILLNKTTLKINDNSLFNGQESLSYIPRLSAGIDFYFNKSTRRLIFRNELGFTAAKPRFKRYNSQGIALQYGFDQYTASLSPQIIYNFYNSNRVKVFAGVGLNLNYSIYKNNSVTGTTPSEPRDYYILEHVWNTVPLQAGIMFNNKIDLFVTYASLDAYLNSINPYIKSGTAGIGIHYIFGR